MPDTVDFKSEIDELLNPAVQVGPGQVEIWGGEFPVEELARFLETWNLASRAMEWRIWEYAHRIEFTRDSPPSEDLSLFERARLFGDDGDLTLRRDGDRVFWSFVGKAAPPVEGGVSFWEKVPDARLRRWERTVLVWGEQQKRSSGTRPIGWHEDRVGWADLRYPHPPAGRLSLRYSEFSDGGQVAFVWWKELIAHGER